MHVSCAGRAPALIEQAQTSRRLAAYGRLLSCGTQISMIYGDFPMKSVPICVQNEDPHGRHQNPDSDAHLLSRQDSKLTADLDLQARLKVGRPLSLPSISI